MWILYQDNLLNNIGSFDWAFERFMFSLRAGDTVEMVEV